MIITPGFTKGCLLLILLIYTSRLLRVLHQITAFFSVILSFFKVFPFILILVGVRTFGQFVLVEARRESERITLSGRITVYNYVQYIKRIRTLSY